MLGAAELERMLVEDRQQQVRRDHETLLGLGIVERKFNPTQPRDPGGEDGGQWVKSPGSSAAKAVGKDMLKLAGKIDLDSGETLVASDKISGDAGSVRFAVTEHNGKRLFRLGLGGPTFGSRDDDAGPWRGNRDATKEINAERKRLRDEHDSVEAQLGDLEDNPDANPKRKAALQARLDELEDMDLGDVEPDGFTARIDEQSAERLRTSLTKALGVGKKVQAEVEAAYDRGEELQPPEQGFWTIAEGSIPGEWADVHYNVQFDDPSVGVEVYLGAVPPGSTFEDVTDREQDARLDPAETKRFLNLLGRHVGGE